MTPLTRNTDNRKTTQMQITIDTNNLSELDIAMLAFLAGRFDETEDEPEPVAEAPKPKAKTEPKKAAEPAKEPEPTPEPAEEDLLGGEDAPTMSQAIAKATELVSSGGAAKVKTALAAVGVKRVSEMKDADIPTFFAALES